MSLDTSLKDLKGRESRVVSSTVSPATGPSSHQTLRRPTPLVSCSKVGRRVGQTWVLSSPEIPVEETRKDKVNPPTGKGGGRNGNPDRHRNPLRTNLPNGVLRRNITPLTKQTVKPSGDLPSLDRNPNAGSFLVPRHTPGTDRLQTTHSRPGTRIGTTVPLLTFP